MSPAAAIIRQALGVLTAPGSVVEIRVPDGVRTARGYFDDLDLAAAAAARLNGRSSVYQTLNPVDPSLLARAVNRIAERTKASTTDRDILRHLWLPLDYDPVRPSEISSTDAEHKAAIARAREVFAYLHSLGWPDPIIADSGNGGHSLYRIDLPNNAESTDLLKRCLQALSLRFSDNVVKVDETVFNPARIWKVYGTIACKGDSTADRPHREAKLLRVPDELEVVSLDKLIALADTVPKPSQGDARHSGKRFDLDRWISDHGLDVEGPLEWSGGRKWIFRVCPWNDAHGDRAAYIVQLPGGAIAAGCHHDSCSGQDWALLRSIYEPEHGKAREEPGKGADDQRAEERRGPAEEAAKGNGKDAETTRSYPDIPPLADLRIDPAELGTARLTPQCVVESYLYADVALLAAPGGSGKTTSALYESVHIVRGTLLYGLRVHTQGSVVTSLPRTVESF